MKKILATAMALVLGFSLTTVAFAAETDVTLSVLPSYTVTIPETVKLEKNQTDGTYAKDAEITCSPACLLETKEITVTMASDFELSAEGTGSKLAYTVKVGAATTAIATGDKVATFGTSTTTQSSVLHFAAGIPTYAGDYTDTAVFTIALTDK